MLSKKKKVFILVGMVALLVLTGCLNIFLNKTNLGEAETGGNVEYSSFFEAYRATRISSRAESLAILNEIINSPTSTEDAVASATESKIKLANHIDLENTLEGLIMGLGFEDAVVTTSTENINVLIKSESITSVEAARILSAVLENVAEKTADNVRIIPVE